MRKKIEKIKPRGATWYADDKALLLELNRMGVELENKINEIIEYLNSQDLEEIIAVQLWESNRRRMEKILNKEMEERGFMRKNEDTPEEREREVLKDFYNYCRTKRMKSGWAELERYMESYRLDKLKDKK